MQNSYALLKIFLDALKFNDPASYRLGHFVHLSNGLKVSSKGSVVPVALLQENISIEPHFWQKEKSADGINHCQPYFEAAAVGGPLIFQAPNTSSHPALKGVASSSH